MKKDIVLYLDPVNKATKTFIESTCPSNLEVLFAQEENTNNTIPWNEIKYIMLAGAELTGDTIRRTKNLKLIQKTGVGVEKIDVETASSLGIPVAITPTANSTAVAELAILFILALYRKLIELDESTKKGNWLMWEKRLESFELKGKKAGLIGFGHIGRVLAKKLKALDVDVSYYDINPLDKKEERELGVSYKEFHQILKESDIISLHIPLTSETRGLISEKEFEMMKDTALLINTSRGAVIDEVELVSAIQKSKIAGVGLDTYSLEPIDPKNPLLSLDNVITTPHVGAGTIDTWERVLNMAFSNIQRTAMAHRPQYIINEKLI